MRPNGEVRRNFEHLPTTKRDINQSPMFLLGHILTRPNITSPKRKTTTILQFKENTYKSLFLTKCILSCFVFRPRLQASVQGLLHLWMYPTLLGCYPNDPHIFLPFKDLHHKLTPLKPKGSPKKKEDKV